VAVGVTVIAGSSYTAYDRSQAGEASAAVAVRTNAVGNVKALVDKTASVEIAAEVAAQVKLPVAQEVIQYAKAVKSETALGYSADSSFTKPQLVSTSGINNREVTTYTSKEGDTIESVARKFDLNADTIRWANDLNEWDQLQSGQRLTILPVNGVLHRVSENDTPADLADKYGVEADVIISFNDAEVEGLKAGQKVIVPGGVKASAPRYRVPTNSYVANYFGSSSIGYNYKLLPTPGYVNNSYDYGWCTFWAAYRAGQLGNPVPRYLGNANQWVGTNTRPVVGAVGQNFGGLGHVAVVEAVSPDGSMIKYSDMNGLAGWGNAAITTEWVPASHFANYLVW
jgi:LysM repeat protein